MNKLCIYHDNCPDGFAAAWVINYYFRGKVDFHPAKWGENPPPVEDRDVIIVDFSYPKDILDDMCNLAKSLVVLDHHQSTEESLKGLVAVKNVYDLDIAKLRKLFDIKRSGVGLAWDYYFTTAPRLPLVNYIEDKDLWKFELKDSEQVNAGISLWPYNFEVWDYMMLSEKSFNEIRNNGEIVMKKNKQDIEKLLPSLTFRQKIGGYDVPVANMPITLCSEAGNKLAKGEPFAATFYELENYTIYSLRSLREEPQSLDVAKIAEQYGGGGHKHAAGFKIPSSKVFKSLT